MRWKSKRTASEGVSPIAASAVVAFRFISVSIRTCSIELCVVIRASCIASATQSVIPARSSQRDAVTQPPASQAQRHLVVEQAR